MHPLRSNLITLLGRKNVSKDKREIRKFLITINVAGLWVFSEPILGLQSISWDVTDNVRHPRRLDPTMELTTYSFVL